jgi:hypothetical protein
MSTLRQKSIDTRLAPIDEPAFPQFSQYSDGLELFGGMKLRDYFAGQALAGIMGSGDIFPPDSAASRSYCVADAMLKERARTGGVK